MELVDNLVYAYVRQDGKGLIAISVVLTQDVSKVPARKGLMEVKNHGHVTAMKVTVECCAIVKQDKPLLMADLHFHGDDMDFKAHQTTFSAVLGSSKYNEQQL